MKNKGPEALGGTPVLIHLYVEDVDKVVAQAVKAGAKVTQAVEDKFQVGLIQYHHRIWYILFFAHSLPGYRIPQHTTGTSPVAARKGPSFFRPAPFSCIVKKSIE